MYWHLFLKIHCSNTLSCKQTVLISCLGKHVTILIYINATTVINTPFLFCKTLTYQNGKIPGIKANREPRRFYISTCQVYCVNCIIISNLQHMPWLTEHTHELPGPAQFACFSMTWPKSVIICKQPKIVSIQVYGYTYWGSNSAIFIFNWVDSSKKEFAPKSKFFPLRVPHLEGRHNENCRVVSLGSIPIHRTLTLHP